MCSFHFSTKKIEPKEIDHVNFFLKKRGPDATQVEYRGEHTFIHNLLSLTGTFTTQPLIENETYVLFNGEIYNYSSLGDYDNDTKCILPTYEKFNIDFVKELDGEFAITIVDYKKNIIIVTTDIFSTKPLWIARENGQFGSSSYESSLLRSGFSKSCIEKMPANTTRIYTLNTGELQYETTVYDFNLDQYKTNFNDWTDAFERAMQKRCTNIKDEIFIGLSSGYDSGAIACSLLKHKIEFNSYTLLGSENEAVLRERGYCITNSRLNVKTHKMEKIPGWDKERKDWLNQHVEEFLYVTRTRRSGYNENDLRLQDDNGSSGLTAICTEAKKNVKNKIIISGQGADEIFSDYGYNGYSKYAHSNFGGLFPEDLTKDDFFPWPSFFGSSMTSYLCKEEYIAGNHGFEARYPFLDKQVVQEFLNLTSELKNSRYKSVLDNYLTINNFPFARDQKIGF